MGIQEENKKAWEAQQERMRKFFEKEADMHASPMGEEGFQKLRPKIQEFLDSLPCTTLLIVSLPGGGFCQFNTSGMPSERGIGMLHHAILDHNAGITALRALQLIEQDMMARKQQENEC